MTPFSSVHTHTHAWWFHSKYMTACPQPPPTFNPCWMVIPDTNPWSVFFCCCFLSLKFPINRPQHFRILKSFHNSLTVGQACLIKVLYIIWYLSVAPRYSECTMHCSLTKKKKEKLFNRRSQCSFVCQAQVKKKHTFARFYIAQTEKARAGGGVVIKTHSFKGEKEIDPGKQKGKDFKVDSGSKSRISRLI